MNVADKEVVARWVEQAFPLGEVLAACSGFPDGSLVHHGATREFAECLKDDCWNLIGHTVAELAQHEFDARCSVWVFERSMLWISALADGTWVGVFTGRELSESAQAEYRTRLGEFNA